MITLRQLEIFVAVVRAGSFRRCAEQLGLSQVSVSEQIRTLEQRLGVTLFDRMAGGPPIITEKGRSAHARIVEILGSVDDLLSDMDGRATRNGRTLQVSMHSFLTRDLRPVLTGFAQSHPQVDVRLDRELRTQHELLEMVARRTLDLAYFFTLDPPAGTRLVRHEELAIFISEDHPLGNLPVVDIDDLVKTPALLLAPSNPLRITVDRAFAALGISDRCIGIETDDFGMILGSAQRGQGYACLFEATARQPSSLLGLRKIVLSRPLPPLQVRCASRSSSAKDLVLNTFCEAVENCWKTAATD